MRNVTNWGTKMNKPWIVIILQAAAPCTKAAINKNPYEGSTDAGTLTNRESVELSEYISALEDKLAAMNDYVTHHGDWVEACKAALDSTGRSEDIAYWHKQLRTLHKLKQGNENE